MKYISREGSAIINISKYLLTTHVGDRLVTIDQLSERYEISVGFAQKALTTIEEAKGASFQRQGRNGTCIQSLDEQVLTRLAGISHLVCAMPLPYTKHYEGLASALKMQMNEVPFYFAHMRGAHTRAECLEAGTYDIAIMSKAAAKTHDKELMIALELGQHSYTNEHKLIFRRGEYEKIRRVGVDSDSPDQTLLTEQFFSDREIELVEIGYGDGINRLNNKQIDAVIWLPEAVEMNALGLEQRSLLDAPLSREASEAVLLVHKDSEYLRSLLTKVLDIDALKSHQQQVINGDIFPSY